MIYVVIPAYNEQEKIKSSIENIIDSLGKRKYQIVVVDDGSSDKTVVRLKSIENKYSLKILKHNCNSGPGAAVRTALEWVLNKAKDSDVLITMESDGSNEKNLLIKMVEAVESGRSNVVLAGCYAPGGGMENVPLKRQILSRTANGLLRLAFPISGVFTYSSLLRAYEVGVLRRATKELNEKLIVDNGFFSTVEILIKLSKFRWVKIKEMPMTLDWGNEKRVSRMKIGRTIVSYLTNVFKYKMEGL